METVLREATRTHLGVSLSIWSREQRVKDDDSLIQVPDKDALQVRLGPRRGLGSTPAPRPGHSPFTNKNNNILANKANTINNILANKTNTNNNILANKTNINNSISANKTKTFVSDKHYRLISVII